MAAEAFEASVEVVAQGGDGDAERFGGLDECCPTGVHEQDGLALVLAQPVQSGWQARLEAVSFGDIGPDGRKRLAP